MSLKEVQHTWEQIGRDDPLWGVLSWAGTEHGAWDIERFFAEGEHEVAQFLREADALGVAVGSGRVLDFGCGVGRLSRALADRFERVDGIDISAPMIDQAQRLVAGERPNCSFAVSTSATLPFEDSTFDLVLSNIVLQHMPSGLASDYVAEFFRVLRRDGVAIFQIPSEQLHGSTSNNALIRTVMDLLPSQWRDEILRRRGPKGPRELPMHGTPRAKMLSQTEKRGGRVVACIEDNAAGPIWRSFHYIAKASKPNYS